LKLISSKTEQLFALPKEYFGWLLQPPLAQDFGI
jgi:hypothetical protein